ncbi:hypothetical protein Noda2021_01950 [Candidatus Dependentiae bacterium Noda2021]|nr:hypothetical protein Noda2021_01950 [Candidatus Dependentiae bacterium Noda2021]
MILFVIIVLLSAIPNLRADQQSFKVPVQGSITLHIQNNAVQAIHMADRSEFPVKAYHAIQSTIHRLHDWCSHNPIKLLLGVGFVSYGAVWALICYVRALEYAQGNWALWKNHVAHEVLQEVPIDDFINELALDVIQRYDKANAWVAWSALLKDVDSYTKCYTNTLAILKTLRAGHISFLWGNTAQLIETIEKRMVRLSLIKMRVTSFLHAHVSSFAARTS